jgi:hypothetical protein
MVGRPIPAFRERKTKRLAVDNPHPITEIKDGLIIKVIRKCGPLYLDKCLSAQNRRAEPGVAGT